MKNFLSFLFSTHECTFCNNKITVSEKILCTSCVQSILPVIPLFVKRNKKFHYTVYSLGAHTGILSRAIKNKYSKNPSILYTLAPLLAGIIRNSKEQYDCIMPIPMHPVKQAIRWFNQSYELSYALSKELQIPLVNGIIKNRYTSSQTQLNTSERKENIKNCFSLSCTQHYNHILLVDDVYTSGATIEEAIKTIYNNCEKISVATLSRSI